MGCRSCARRAAWPPPPSSNGCERTAVHHRGVALRWGECVSGQEPVRDDLSEIMAGLRSFIDSEVIARHQDEGETLRDPRLIYEPNGRFTPKVLDTMREIRQASAK